MQPFNIALIMRRSGQLIGNAARVFLRACVDKQLRIIPRYVNPLGLDGCSKAPFSFEGVGGDKPVNSKPEELTLIFANGFRSFLLTGVKQTPA